MPTKVTIEKILRDAFSPDELTVIDHSAAHAGHAGAQQSGGGHYEVQITSRQFTGKKTIERHRMVNNVLFKGEIKTKIHALIIKAMAPEER